MQIELRPIDQIKPYPGNPRQNDEAVDAVAASLKEFGFRHGNAPPPHRAAAQPGSKFEASNDSLKPANQPKCGHLTDGGCALNVRTAFTGAAP